MSRKRRVQGYSNQVIGNNAVKLPVEVEEALPKKRVGTAKKSNRKPEVSFKRDGKVSFVLAFVIIATLGICVAYLQAQYTLNVTESRIEESKKELAKIQEENTELEQEIDNSIDLDQIYIEATTRLNMHLPSSDEVFYVDNYSSSYLTKYGQIEVDQPETTIGSVLGYITKGW